MVRTGNLVDLAHAHQTAEELAFRTLKALTDSVAVETLSFQLPKRERMPIGTDCTHNISSLTLIAHRELAVCAIPTHSNLRALDALGGGRPPLSRMFVRAFHSFEGGFSASTAEIVLADLTVPAAGVLVAVQAGTDICLPESMMFVQAGLDIEGSRPAFTTDGIFTFFDSTDEPVLLSIHPLESTAIGTGIEHWHPLKPIM